MGKCTRIRVSLIRDKSSTVGSRLTALVAIIWESWVLFLLAMRDTPDFIQPKKSQITTNHTPLIHSTDLDAFQLYHVTTKDQNAKVYQAAGSVAVDLFCSLRMLKPLYTKNLDLFTPSVLMANPGCLFISFSIPFEENPVITFSLLTFVSEWGFSYLRQPKARNTLTIISERSCWARRLHLMKNHCVAGDDSQYQNYLILGRFAQSAMNDNDLVWLVSPDWIG